MASEKEIDEAARASYEHRIRQQFKCEPGQGWIAGSMQRTYAWGEMPEILKVAERSIAKAALEAAEAVRWMPIESAPRDGDDILLGCFGEHGHGMQFVAFWNDEAKHDTNRWQTADGIAYHNDLPTHFQLLPSPPESNSK